jgi:glucose-6-phosphate-specific signal transduction histidine kinase
VLIHDTARAIELEIVDDAPAVEPAVRTTGHGLIGMRRAREHLSALWGEVVETICSM